MNLGGAIRGAGQQIDNACVKVAVESERWPAFYGKPMTLKLSSFEE